MARKAENLIVAVVVLTLCAASASAEIIEIGLTDNVTYIDDQGGLLGGQIAIGDIITGSYTYDTSTPDSNPLSTVADYVHSSPPYGVSLSVCGFTFQSDPDNPYFLIEILNDHTGMDGYLFRSYKNLPLPNGLEVDHISWQLQYRASAA